MKEIIKRFNNTKIYVSNLGKAFKFEDGAIKEIDLIQNGDKKAIGLEGKKRINIDSLVWRTFKEETGGRARLHIKHIDGDLDNNRLDNLEMPQIKIKKSVQVNMYGEAYELLQEKIKQLEEKLAKMEVQND